MYIISVHHHRRGLNWVALDNMGCGGGGGGRAKCDKFKYGPLRLSELSTGWINAIGRIY